MSDRHIIKKIKYLQNIKPRKDWVKSNRELLLQQIGTQEKQPLVDVQGLGRQLVKLFVLEKYALVARPVVAITLVAILVLGSGIATVSATRQSLPGEALYNVKLVVEKTRVVLTLDEVEKTKLHMEFADRRTGELAKIKERPNGGKEEKIKDVVENLKKEIKVVENNLENLDPETRKEAAKSIKVAAATVEAEERALGPEPVKSLVLAEKPLAEKPLAEKPKESEEEQEAQAAVTEASSKQPQLESAEKSLEKPRLKHYPRKIVRTINTAPSALGVFSTLGHTVFNDQATEIERLKKNRAFSVFNQPPPKSVF